MKKTSVILIIATCIVYFLPLTIALERVLSGETPFWYDNARDMLSAWANLQKPTLIGPTSGIPGIFYGPYWIWLLSIGVLFSKDPRIPALIAGIIPYFVLFPIVLSRFTKVFDSTTLLIVWTFFILSTGMTYATNLWNPFLAPFFLIVLLSLLMDINVEKIDRNTALQILFTGILVGIIINFHISIGSGVLLGSFLFFLLQALRQCLKHKNQIKKILLKGLFQLLILSSGIMTIFIPFFIFEIRHNFNQIKTILAALTSYGGIVTLTGLRKGEILQQFFGRAAEALQMNQSLVFISGVICIGYFLFAIKSKKITLHPTEKNLCLAIISITSSILFIYLTARNPVWSYHFIGVEILLLLLLAFLLQKVRTLQYALLLWVFFLTVTAGIQFIKSFNNNPLLLSSLITKEYITDLVGKDAEEDSYTFFSYSPSIYQYDYTYLFKWRYNKDIPYDPGTINTDTEFIYVLLPQKTDPKVEDFFNYRTPPSNYSTVRSWNIDDGSVLMKRKRLK